MNIWKPNRLSRVQDEPRCVDCKTTEDVDWVDENDDGKRTPLCSECFLKREYGFKGLI